jgi:hypothetical protein
MSRYPDLIGAINGLYEKKDDILVVDFHQHNDFHADVSLPHTVTTLASPTPFDIFWNSSYLALKHERWHVGLFQYCKREATTLVMLYRQTIPLLESTSPVI